MERSAISFQQSALVERATRRAVLSDHDPNSSLVTHHSSLARRRRAFTLIELLTVIAIIGILAAIIIPTAGSVRNSAKRAETKVRFSQWATAMEQFKQEYGFYPQIDNGTGKILPARFAAALTGRDLNGNAYTDTSNADLCGNKKLISFYSISESELSNGAIVDSFGNTDIAVLYDQNGDGRITSADGLKTTFQFADNTSGPSDDDLNLSTGVHAGVIFYSAGRGNSSSDAVYSWK